MNIELKDITLDTVSHLAAANSLLFPFLFSLYYSKWSICCVSLISCISANMRLYIRLNNNTSTVENVSIAIDSICGVLVTFVCAYTLKLNKSCVGTFRVLWLVALITSSTSYSFFKNITNQSMIPNDVSVVMLGISGILLIFTALYSKCCIQRNNDEFDNFRLQQDKKKKLVAESVLVFAALILRFEGEIENLIHANIGIPVWHFSCALSLFICLFVN